MLNETACLADKIVELTLSLGELLPLLHFEHNPINQALFNEIIGVLFATIALRPLHGKSRQRKSTTSPLSYRSHRATLPTI